MAEAVVYVEQSEYPRWKEIYHSTQVAFAAGGWSSFGTKVPRKAAASLRVGESLNACSIAPNFRCKWLAGLKTKSDSITIEFDRICSNLFQVIL